MTATAPPPSTPSDAFVAAGRWPGVLDRLLAGRDLDGDTAAAVMEVVLRGEATAAQIAGVLVALRAKGETPDELAGMLRAALSAAHRVPLTDDEAAAAIDIVGTGGDGSHSINVSTMAALVVAGGGVAVCKHGNRSASSQCGAADVLEALGVAVELDGDGVARCVRAAGIGFCLATAFHAAFRHAGPPRRELGVRTAFNLVGPMANPGGVRNLVIGVADGSKARTMAEALQRRGASSVWVVHGDGLDELSTTGRSQVVALRDDELSTFTVDPAALGLARATADDLRGGGPADNAAAARAVLAGATGPHRDIVLLNAAAGFVVAGRCADLAAGLELAAASIDSGAAAAALERLVATSVAAAGAGGNSR